MLKGECLGLIEEGGNVRLTHNCTCGKRMLLEVLHTPAGYYLGYYCNKCGPYSRETHYGTEAQATATLDYLIGRDVGGKEGVLPRS